ncbi:MAG: hypothetical protein Q9Q40_15615, partial [Acidobacteriota bacterium]|nr:hypothetical protein [Acidobacteriota bacterium]
MKPTKCRPSHTRQARFDAYRGKAPWFLVAELTMSVVSSFIVGLQEYLGCVPSAWMLTAVYIIFTAVLAVVRPHAVRLDRLLYFVLALLQTGAAVFAAAAAASLDPGSPEHAAALEVGSYFLSALSAGSMLVGLYELGKVLYEQWQVWQRMLQRRRSDQP